MGTEPSLEFCRQIERYLCQKNDGHLIRVTGPSFELVAGWAEKGIPLKIAFAGIDRCFERYHRTRRRRPLKIDFCDADVLNAFDEWRRAVGAAPSDDAVSRPGTRRESLPAHLERVVLRLTSGRASGSLGEEFDSLIDQVACELDAARAGAARGSARHALIERLATLDADFIRQARSALTESSRTAIAREAAEELAPFRAAMAPEAFARAHEAAMNRLVRERLGLPTIAFAA